MMTLKDLADRINEQYNIPVSIVYLCHFIVFYLSKEWGSAICRYSAKEEDYVFIQYHKGEKVLEQHIFEFPPYLLTDIIRAFLEECKICIDDKNEISQIFVLSHEHN